MNQMRLKFASKIYSFFRIDRNKTLVHSKSALLSYPANWTEFRSILCALVVLNTTILTTGCRPERINNQDSLSTLSTQKTSVLSFSPSSVVIFTGTSVSASPSSSLTFTSYAISPSLPAGLSLNSSTGVISGTASSTLSKTTYTITASNGSTTQTASFELTVNAPTQNSSFYFNYPDLSVSFTVGDSVSITPSLGSTPLSGFNASLPAGLSVDSSTGVISGTPSTSSAQTTYTISATHSGGTATFDLAMTILAAPAPPPAWYKLSAGQRTNCTTVGDVANCWGDDLSGQVGDNSPGINLTPSAVSGLSSTPTQISAGSKHSCAVAGSAAYCWGSNYYGQLGIKVSYSSGIYSIASGVVGLSSGVSQISAGSGHTCAVVNGAAKCWGNNNYGQLGVANYTGYGTPRSTVNLTSGVTQIDTGGDDNRGRTCAIKNGALFCWGDNTHAPLGFTTADSGTYVPTLVPGLTTGTTQVSVGNESTCAVQDGNVKCWGNNHYGELGIGSIGPQTAPVAIGSGLASGAVTQVSTGFSHSCAVVNGAAKCWGSNYYGQLGTGTYFDSSGGTFSGTESLTPVQVSGLGSGVVAVSASKYTYSASTGYSANRYGHTCALLSDDSIKCWGKANYGQIGDGASGTSFSGGPNAIRRIPTSVTGF